MALEAQSSPNARAAGLPLRSASARERLATLFPDPSAPRPRWFQRKRRLVVGMIAVVAVGSLVLASQAFGATDAGYRTAVVDQHDVDALLNGVASVEPISQSSVSFPSSGTVASVNVKVGDPVTVGQPLASLDPAALTQTLHDREASLAQAELVLSRALNGESVSGSGGVSGAGTGSGSSASGSGGGVKLTALSIPAGASGPSGTNGSGAPGAGASLPDAQQAVLAAQQRVDAAINTATEALDSAATVCAAAGVGTTGPAAPTSGALTACQTATRSVLRAQTAVSTAQQQLAQASTALDALLAQQAAAAVSGGNAGSGTGASAGGSSPVGAPGSSPATAAAPSSADLAADQKAVDAAAAEVVAAQQAIAQATIVSPIAGTVEAVNLAVGDSVTSASSTANIVVVGTGGYEITTTVSVDDITKIKVGQPATFLPDGRKQPLAGTVTAISIAPDNNATATSYRVVIGLTGKGTNLDNGSTGSVAIVTASSRAALAVPTSAVTAIGSRHTVTVLDGSTARRVLVQVGVIGATWTAIESGVTAGQQVVLADLSQPLPGSATASSSSGSGTTGPGGFPAGGPPGPFFRGAPGQ